MNRALLISSAVSAFGGVLGWVTAPTSAMTPPAMTPASINSIDRLRDDYAQAREVLAQVSFFAAVAPEEAAFEPAPPPDIAHLFRRDLTAIETRTDGAIVWIVDFTQPHGRRGLRVGEIYQDGWRIAAIESQAIVLRRRGESRRVDAFRLAPEGSW